MKVEKENTDTKRAIQELMDKDYRGFVSGLISIEKQIENKEVLERMTDIYMDSDSSLLSEEFDTIQEEVSVELEDKNTKKTMTRKTEAFRRQSLER